MLENQFQYELLEAGCDEAGRGCLAGPVFAAAVILPPDFHDERLNDSKQMTERNRDRLREVIEREAVAWAVEAVPAARIDEINILNASFEGMSLAVARLDPAPGFLLIDGNRFRTQLTIPYRCVVKGDGKYADIAAASVLAKTHRDEYMRRLADEGRTMLVVTHEMSFARAVASEVVFMDQGVICEHGDPKDVLGAPKTERLKAFLASML